MASLCTACLAWYDPLMDCGSALEREKNFFFCFGESAPLSVVAVDTVECVDAASLRFWETWELLELEETKLVILIVVMVLMVMAREEIFGSEIEVENRFEFGIDMLISSWNGGWVNQE